MVGTLHTSLDHRTEGWWNRPTEVEPLATASILIELGGFIDGHQSTGPLGYRYSHPEQSGRSGCGEPFLSRIIE